MAATAPAASLFPANVGVTVKVEGRDGGSGGLVHAVMVGKRSGRVTHAVLSLGGFLGIGKSFYPVPWTLLSYDPVRDVYVVTVDKSLLEGGPSWANNAPLFDQAYADRVASYYGVGREELTGG